MGNAETFTLGLPDGKHIRKATFDLLKMAGLSVPAYSPSSKSRSYKTFFGLPSGNGCMAHIDKPRDLLYSLLWKKCDLIITGSDYVEDLIAADLNSGSALFRKGVFGHGHARLNHLGYFGTRLAFMANKDAPFQSVEEIIETGKEFRCFTEFPSIAAKNIAGLSCYKKKFGASRPKVVSPFCECGDNKEALIAYSHGATESKAACFENDIALDLVMTGETMRQNGLKALAFVGNPIFNQIYARESAVNQKKGVKEFIDLIEETVIKNPQKYKISYKKS